jgi:hypothetical protein
MRFWIIAAAFAVLATPSLAQDLPPPTPEGVLVRIGADQSGQSIEAAQGEGIAVELQSSPSAGASWRVAAKPDFLADPEQISGPMTATAPGARPRLGAPRWQVFVFPVASAGTGDLVLQKSGPGGAVLETLTITIVAQ